MRENREIVLKWTGISEGGYVNDPDDPGGPTNHGVTQRTLDGFRKANGLPAMDVRELTQEQADEILSRQYFDPVRFDDLPAGVDYAIADFAVNSGVSRAVKEAQKVVGVTPDGVLGVVTLGAIAARCATYAGARRFIEDYCAARMAFLKELKGWKKFGNGWTKRVMGRVDGVQDDDIGVIDRAARMTTSIAPASIPAPADHGTAKGEGEVAAAKILGKVMSDPLASFAGVMSAITPLASGSEPIQWAIAATVVVLIGVLAWRMVKRSANA